MNSQNSSIPNMTSTIWDWCCVPVYTNPENNIKIKNFLIDNIEPGDYWIYLNTNKFYFKNQEDLNLFKLFLESII